MFLNVLVAEWICTIIGVIYPCVHTYLVVKNKNTDQYARWAMFWIVQSILFVGEFFVGMLISSFSFYYEIKIVFFLWLVLPRYDGSKVLYNKFVSPVLSDNEEVIDGFVDGVQDRLKAGINSAKETFFTKVRENSAQLLSAGTSLLSAANQQKPKKKKNVEKVGSDSEEEVEDSE
eukprot:TRINITY_DN21324_c0_g1_i1.p1 TRINITY_DN21324_c0_g1~~TRINITY_DN21324_c0_g1_i1.p1  ORF type:complete len:175 (+),score=41.87 TRINITY_DN21324_c0_g1_i1:113-637(+)